MYSPYDSSSNQTRRINQNKTNIHFILISADDMNTEIVKLSKYVVNPQQPWKNGETNIMYFVRRGNDVKKIDKGSSEDMISYNDGGTRVFNLEGVKLIIPHDDPHFPGSLKEKSPTFGGLKMNMISHMSKQMENSIS